MDTKMIISVATTVLILSLATACVFFSDEKAADSPESPSVYLLTGKDSGGHFTNEDFEQLREDMARPRNSDDREMPAGYLPDGIKQGTRQYDSEAYVVNPDTFSEIARLYRENTLQLHAQFGEDRIIVSNWTDGIAGVDHPIIIWEDGARCELETTKDNVAAIVATPANHEVVVSGHIRYDRPAFTMTGCRIHGYYNGSGPPHPPSFQHALAPNPNQAGE